MSELLRSFAVAFVAGLAFGTAFSLPVWFIALWVWWRARRPRDLSKLVEECVGSGIETRNRAVTSLHRETPNK